MPTVHGGTHAFLLEALRYLRTETFEFLRTSRTVKNIRLSHNDLVRAVEFGKFELCGDNVRHPLPEGVHGVNLFTVNEAKGRRRLITEPHLNGVIKKYELPPISRLSRLERRQRLRHARYMFQLDFEAFYDAIPLPRDLRDKFVFRTREGAMYRLTTLPTGARWSVAVGQAVTWTIVDIDTPVFIETMIDNVLIAAEEGQEVAFVAAVRTVVDRIRVANLLTSPDREAVAVMPDSALLDEAKSRCVFLGEEYVWEEGERQVRNTVKTVTKIDLASRAEQFTFRSFASLVSLITYAVHTTTLNPAYLFPLMRMYRALFRMVARGKSWEDHVTYISTSIRSTLQHFALLLLANPLCRIPEPIQATYDDEDYDIVVFTDASARGWGAVARWRGGQTQSFQQRWVHDLQVRGVPSGTGTTVPFNARFSANAEPHAALLFLQLVLARGAVRGMRIAVVTDHYPIALAQRGENGFRGIGRGYYLNNLYTFTNDLFHRQGVRVVFFYIDGACNPADRLSRNFGEDVSDGEVAVREAADMVLPRLINTACPVCEKQGQHASMGSVFPGYARLATQNEQR
ncbi:hypothetical protein NESM_000894700 [Novymonas esmeraldas]|uniref:Reverse transcriptase domain-containing protein n=1 Tax=Novymonas esmeraldas TaxID=1808958 RepID=A0AAW0F201_9TRYP